MYNGGKMKRTALLLVPLILVACTSQLSAHEQSTSKVISPEAFKPVIINPTTAPALIVVDTIGQEPVATKPPIKQPEPKKAVIQKTAQSPVVAATTSPRKYALSVVGQKQFNCLEPLWDKESHWNYKAHNSSSGAYGIPQAVPGSKMSSAGADWKTNPITQVKWGINYVNGRYGSACGAWSFWKRNGWY
jgi:hypothetical protein